MGQLAPARTCSSGSTATMPLPLHEQIERSIRDDIRAGRLGAGSRLPSSRALATELGVSRGVVTEAYGQLAAEGYLPHAPGRAGPGRQRGPRLGAAGAGPLAAAELHLPLPPRPARPRRVPPRPLAAVAARRLAPGPDRGDRLRRPARRPRAARGARRVPRTGARRRHRPRAHSDLHRVHPGPLAALPLAGRRGSRAGRARGPGLAPAPA